MPKTLLQEALAEIQFAGVHASTAKMSPKQLVSRDAKRDLGAELLQAAREMRAGVGRQVWPPSERSAIGPRLSNSTPLRNRESKTRRKP